MNKCTELGDFTGTNYRQSANYSQSKRGPYLSVDDVFFPEAEKANQAEESHDEIAWNR
jgi:hypothetical protein